jgi:hypothetical protein
MKKEHIIMLIGGVILACLIYKAGRKGTISSGVIKPGDKGNDVYALQSMLASVTGEKFSSMGAYDNNTLTAVQFYMKGTSALVDYDNGYVKKDFSNDLYVIQSRIKQ